MYMKILNMRGLGNRFKAMPVGDDNTFQLELFYGTSHPVIETVPKGIGIIVDDLCLVLFGESKSEVHSFAAYVRNLCVPDAYKGKGISYEGEVLRLKEGKRTS